MGILGHAFPDLPSYEVKGLWTNDVLTLIDMLLLIVFLWLVYLQERITGFVESVRSPFDVSTMFPSCLN